MAPIMPTVKVQHLGELGEGGGRILAQPSADLSGLGRKTLGIRRHQTRLTPLRPEGLR